MAKISVIKVLLSVFGVISIAFIVFIAKLPDVHGVTITNDPSLRNMKIIGIVNGIMQLPVIACLITAMHYFLRYGYFNQKSISLLKATAYIMAAGVSIQLILNLALNYIPGWTPWARLPSVLLSLMPQLLISLGIRTVADFLKQGRNLEAENNLTI